MSHYYRSFQSIKGIANSYQILLFEEHIGYTGLCIKDMPRTTDGIIRGRWLFGQTITHAHRSFEGMALSGLLVCSLVATLVVVGLASPTSKSGGDTKPSGRLSQLMASRREAMENAAPLGQDTQTRMERRERMSHLSEEQREFMSKQIMQAISGLYCSQR
ncbi:uncharacterized protein LOC105021474 isoform X2 [Esox lucius]|uniref:uncharacterized protein LOC105021474 isoform X2 n=1 Tax=Esox lucius TaxID=8010 RepID=UPI000577FE1B|nr:uncharacterized protein LOC105021474 isoform X2 [Esox lucius]